jgi:hypothetical protein
MFHKYVVRTELAQVSGKRFNLVTKAMNVKVGRQCQLLKEAERAAGHVGQVNNTDKTECLRLLKGEGSVHEQWVIIFTLRLCLRA